MDFCNEIDLAAGENEAWQQALEVMFALASAGRHLARPTRYAWRAALRARGIRPPLRKAFWLRLMRSAGLVDALPGGLHRPTARLPGWFERPAARQARDLVEAWVRLPITLRARQDRRRIVRKLAHPLGPQPLTSSELGQVATLRRLGLWDAAARELTGLGRLALQNAPGRQAAADPAGASAWSITTSSVQVCPGRPARNLSMLWALEAFLQPYAPGFYLLTPPALRRAAQRGSLEELAGVLERGAGAPLAPEIRARILDLPQARLLAGSVLEFDSSAELAALRRRPVLRRRLDRLLSPRHVYLPEHARPGALAALERAGIPVAARPAALPEPCGGTGANSPPLADGELADLYAAALAAHQVGLGAFVSSELLEKIAGMLPPALRRAAQASAEQAAAARMPPPRWSLPDHPGPAPAGRIEALQRAADREETITVWYNPAGAQQPEQRRLTPLLIEQRGLALYLQAYCHRRRANRTFRIDRMVLEDELPNGHGPAP